MQIAQVIAELWTLLKENVSTIALLIFNYEEYKIARAKREAADAMLAKSLEENKNEIAQKYAGKSDDDIIADKFGDGSDSGDSGPKGQSGKPD